MAQANVIRFWRGNRTDLPQVAAAGIPLWCVDSQELFIGTDNGVAPAFVDTSSGDAVIRRLPLTGDGEPLVDNDGQPVASATTVALYIGSDDRLYIQDDDGALTALYSEAGAVFAGNIDSEDAADGQYLAADGAGSADWRDVPPGISTAQAQKLAGIEASATADQTAAEIKAAYESNPDTNAYPDADAAKVGQLSVTQPVDLDAIESRVNGLDAAVVLAGSWDASSGTFPNSTKAGETFIVSVAGTVDGVDFAANDRLLALEDGAGSTFAGSWLKLDYSDQVLTVAGRTGNVEIGISDVTGLGGLAALDMASQAQAEAATNDLSGMSPLLTRLAFQVFGLGSRSLPDAGDLNMQRPTGFYRVPNTTTGTPADFTGGIGIIATRDQEQTVQYISDVDNKVFSRHSFNGSFTPWHQFWTTANTTVDSNGFLKSASPIVKLYLDRIKKNSDFSALLEKQAIGHYLIRNDYGLAREGWQVETPLDANKQLMVFAKVDELDDASIEVKTYTPLFDGATVRAGTPVDIPESRWIDLRLQEPPESETVNNEGQP